MARNQYYLDLRDLNGMRQKTPQKFRDFFAVLQNIR